MSKRGILDAVHRRSTHLDSSWFGFLCNPNEIRISGVLESMSGDLLIVYIGPKYNGLSASMRGFLDSSKRDPLISGRIIDKFEERNYDDFICLLLASLDINFLY